MDLPCATSAGSSISTHQCIDDMEREMRKHLIAATLASLPLTADATELIFHAGQVNNPSSLQTARNLESTCANINVRFRIQSVPGNPGDLDNQTSQLEAAGHSYYITAGSSDYTNQNLYWDSGAMCWNMLNRPGTKGLFLHEIISARRSASLPFDDTDWTRIQQFAS